VGSDASGTESRFFAAIFHVRLEGTLPELGGLHAGGASSKDMLMPVLLRELPSGSRAAAG